MKKYYDIVFAGGGLANILTALRLSQVRPDLEFLILEQGTTYGGQHTWSFHESDLTPSEWSWVSPFISHSWTGTKVKFPRYTRELYGNYHSLWSEELHQYVMKQLASHDGLGKKVNNVSAAHVTLDNGFTVEAGCVVDGRGWEGSPSIILGYQKFFGLHVQLDKPHELKAPVIMDATVPQEDGYRFMYILPWDEKRMLIEDTYFSRRPQVNEESIRRHIHRYAEEHSWNIQNVEKEEVGLLPLPLTGSLLSWEKGIPLTGLRGGFFHATTGYSLPFAVHVAEAFVHLKQFDHTFVFSHMHRWFKKHWKNQSLFRRLNRFMFQACADENRYKILQTFYEHSEKLIQNFYRGNLSPANQLSLFLKKPPISVWQAAKYVWETSNL